MKRTVLAGRINPGKQRKKLVPKVGLEPTRCRHRQILSLVRLPFRHFGSVWYE